VQKRVGEASEIYEVKTWCARQLPYSAIGEVFVHESDLGKSKRFVVRPQEGDVPKGIGRAFERSGICSIRFKMTSKYGTILV